MRRPSAARVLGRNLLGVAQTGLTDAGMRCNGPHEVTGVYASCLPAVAALLRRQTGVSRPGTSHAIDYLIHSNWPFAARGPLQHAVG